ncbi:hypothetical protein GGG87_02680 [Streptococcus sp. zg-86]|uniref:Strictosidine synthase n=1 Tax=Streptococcus zhangguiae TaxID=2664091 RepID=A0A6I4RGA0_9STRE|nr:MULTISPECIES: hypothetical protein [unclassified Streptococcus]MTB63906.1 hypothetical protein [Streptococcus sp. zg-86]MTB90217.1 hypothetical protein [Streptococcus sp. zg-36]MWV55887.1 hypothetical protein [Streptococcus sp. zg-70]QTH46938.1 hypothetical protein J5M87_05035 [Streptococcus sp. zg-86]
MTKEYDKKFSVSILLWMREDKPRQEGMDYWSGPHSQIIAASPGLSEYRQQHLSETQHSFWPGTAGLETSISPDRRIDGIAEVTFDNLLSPVVGRHQTALAFKDEVNVFRRTLMHMGFPFSSRWFKTAEQSGSQLRDVLYIRRKEGVSSASFKKFINDSFAPEISKVAGVTETRSQVYMPWNKATWDTPNVAHDNPKAEHLHASVIIGFRNQEAREEFYKTIAPKLNHQLISHASAVHAYQIDQTLTYVENGQKTSL